MYFVACAMSGAVHVGRLVLGALSLQIVLVRTDRNVGRDDKSDGAKNRVGIVVTRAPVAKPAGHARKSASKRQTDAFGAPV